MAQQWILPDAKEELIAIFLKLPPKLNQRTFKVPYTRIELCQYLIYTKKLQENSYRPISLIFNDAQCSTKFEKKYSMAH